MKKTLIFLLVLSMAIAAVEFFVSKAPQAALLLNLSFWLSLAQGAVALVAAAELAQGRWILPIKRQLLGMVPILFWGALLFLLLALQWEIYPIHDKHSLWFSKYFFLGRNFFFLLLAFLLAWKYADASLAGKENSSTYAVWYLFVFVICQSLMAFDCMMPLEYPWFSTIYGPYFFVESLYAGIALAGLVSLLLSRQKLSDEKIPQAKKAQYDTGVLLFGFSILWMGFCFFQLIVIWYGNLPEEVSFYTHRLASPLYKTIAFVLLGMFFAVPFVVLISQKAKKSPLVVALVSLIILTALLLERIFIVFPVAPVSTVSAVLEWALFATMFFLLFSSQHLAVEK